MGQCFIYLISFVTIACVIIRPFKLPEAFWAVLGACLLILTRLITIHQAWFGVKDGMDVYLFLTGMMLLSETAKAEGLFDYFAFKTTVLSNGSPIRLFGLIYIVGIFVTAFLSNDATAVVLTPAVIAATKAAKIEKPLPYLFICAFIANAASFILPISNPANLVIFGHQLPPLFRWLKTFFLPSIVSIILTYLFLFKLLKKQLPTYLEVPINKVTLSKGGKVALISIVFTAISIFAFSAMNIPLGIPTCIVGVFSSLIVILSQQKDPMRIVRGISWGVLPLVAGLFIIITALGNTDILDDLKSLLIAQMSHSVKSAAWLAGILPAYGCNVMNNLPAGLVTGYVLQNGNATEMVKSAALIGIDLGPNLSVTGSLATILWLTSLRRAGLSCSAWDFLKIGLIVMPIPLLFSLWVLITLS